MRWPEETTKSKSLHVLLPSLLAAACFVGSLVADLCKPGTHYAQRSGAVVIVVGAYIAFHEAQWRVRFKLTDRGGVERYENPEIWYKWLALALVLVGTALAGYGDLVL